MTIKVSKSENGPYKTEFNYEGCTFSGIDHALKENNTTSDLTLTIPSKTTSKVTLTEIEFEYGILVKANIDAFSEDRIDKPEINNRLVMYPNPAVNFVSVSLPERRGESILNIYNQQGQLIEYFVVEENKSELVIDLHALAKGLYFVNLVTADKTHVGKILRE